MHRWRKGLALLALVSGLSGCGVAGVLHAQFDPVKEAVGGDRVRVRVVADTWDHSGVVWAAPDRDCMDWDAEGAGTVFGATLGLGSRGLRD